MKLDVKTNVFEGPLDLLLHLIEKNKVTIYDIPIALITDQYMEYMEELKSSKMEVMSSFIEMAAKLISIKTKMLLPVKKDENNEEIDPREELVEQLIEYKKYKLISERLSDKQEVAEKIFFKGASIPEEVKEYIPKPNTEELLEGIEFKQLYEIFQSLLKKNIDKIDTVRGEFGTIRKESYTVQDKMSEIKKMRKKHKKISFKTLLEDANGKSELIAIFLAILELMKINEITVRQKNVFHDIDIEFV